MTLSIVREIKINIVNNRYKCTLSYKIPNDVESWRKCPNCSLYPLINEYDNGESTGCGCGENPYNHFSIYSESIMSYVTRNNGSAIDYGKVDNLKSNWNHWVDTGEILVDRKELLKLGRW